MGVITIPETAPIIYHTSTGDNWLTEKAWINYFNIKFKNLDLKKLHRRYMDTEEIPFVIFFTTEVLAATWRHEDSPDKKWKHLMGAICRQRLFMGNYLEVKHIYRYGFSQEVNSIKEVSERLKGHEHIQILTSNRIPVVFIGHFEGYPEALNGISTRMKEVEL